MTKPVLAIIGGGCTGAAIAYHLTRVAHAPVQILIFEPRPVLGPGLAYSAKESLHCINVPAARMSLVPEDPEHFARFAASDADVQHDSNALLPDGRCFPARSVFGRYVAAQLQPALDRGEVEHRRCRAVLAERSGSRWRVVGEDGSEVIADVLVIATSHPPPSPPSALAALAGESKFIADPWASTALDAIAPDDEVLIVGTGLTMADVVVSLDARGHRGTITAISRRGQRSRGHAQTQEEKFGDFVSPPAPTTLALLRHVRRTVREAAEKGIVWQGVFSALRSQSPEIWAALTETERARLVRHLRPFWDTHRFRVAPQVEAVLERRIAEGTLVIRAASIVEVSKEGDGFAVVIKPRHRASAVERFDAIVTTTGPDHRRAIAHEPVLASLAAQGWLQPDRLGLGLLVDRESRAIAADGSTGSLFVAGPLARGTFGELMGLPEVTLHAMFVADQLRDTPFRCASLMRGQASLLAAQRVSLRPHGD